VPYGTDSQSDVGPGNKLPGYDHLVPPGQSPTSPYGTDSRLNGFQAIPRPRMPGYGHLVPPPGQSPTCPIKTGRYRLNPRSHE
jgi:hypothetical protein